MGKDFFIFIRSLFDSTDVRNISAEDLREMEEGGDVNRPRPANSCAVHRSFVRAREHERLANARRSREFLHLQSSSSDEHHNDLVSFPQEHEQSEQSTAEEYTPSEACRRKRSQQSQVSEQEQREDRIASQDVVQYMTTPETGWVLNDKSYLAKVYEHIRWKFPTEQLPPRPTLAFCERRDSAHRKEKDFYTKPDPYIDAWMLITGRQREVFDVVQFVKTYPDVEKWILPARTTLKCRVMRDGCPIARAKQLRLQGEKEQTATSASSNPVRSTGLVVKRKRK